MEQKTPTLKEKKNPDTPKDILFSFSTYSIILIILYMLHVKKKKAEIKKRKRR